MVSLFEKSGAVYRRVLLKLSGEALQGEASFGIDPMVLDRVAGEIAEIQRLGVEVGVVIGGGNLFRGATLSDVGLERITGDHMGMLATVMNALAMRDALEGISIPTHVMSAIPISGIVEHYDRHNAIYHLQQKKVVIFAAGTGNPLVTTDSAASLRAIETKADVLLKATRVDGVYTDDPAKNPDATRYTTLSYDEALEKQLGVMDISAFCQCRDHNVKIQVFNMTTPGALLRVINGEMLGTLVGVDFE